MVLLGAIALAGCPRDRGEETTPRARAGATEADLLTLLPDAVDLVLRVDLARLRRLMRGQRWSKALGPELGRFAADWRRRTGLALWRAVDRLVVALRLVGGGKRARVLVVAQGAPRGGVTLRDRAQRQLRARPPPKKRAPQRRDYRGLPLFVAGASATALLSSRTFAVGAPDLVRQVVDLFRGLDGQASVSEDRSFMNLWGVVGGPKAGQRPHLAAGVRVTDHMRSVLRRQLRFKGRLRHVGLRFSGRQWVTVLGVFDTRGREEAIRLIKALGRLVAKLARSALARKLGIPPFLGALAVHHEGARVYVQYQVRGARFHALALRLVPILRALLPDPKPDLLSPRRPGRLE